MEFQPTEGVASKLPFSIRLSSDPYLTSFTSSTVSPYAYIPPAPLMKRLLNPGLAWKVMVYGVIS
jgi:hypothetical protein